MTTYKYNGYSDDGKCGALRLNEGCGILSPLSGIDAP